MVSFRSFVYWCLSTSRLITIIDLSSYYKRVVFRFTAQETTLRNLLVDEFVHDPVLIECILSDCLTTSNVNL